MIVSKGKYLVPTRFLRKCPRTLSVMARRHQGGPKRQYIWANIVTHMFSVGLGAAKSAGVGLGLSTLDVITLIRSRGTLSVHFDPTSIADVLKVGVGLGIYSSDAFGIGATAMPGPLSDADWDWVWHKTLLLGLAHSATEDGTNILNNLWIDADSKAMRKMKPNQTLGWMVEGEVTSGGGTFDVGVSCRHLFLLS